MSLPALFAPTQHPNIHAKMPKIVYDNFQVLPAVLKDDIMTFEVITTDGDAQKLDTVPSNYQEADDAAKENWFSKLGWYIVEYHSGPAPELDCEF